MKKTNFARRTAKMFFLAVCLFSVKSTGCAETLSFPEMKVDHSMELSYAQEFSVDYYENDCALIQISEGSRFLVVPEGEEVPEEVDSDIVILQQPVTDIYLAATAVMDYFAALDACDAITLSGTNADGWYVEEAKEAMENGEMIYAGKYSAPDYELILSKSCKLAIESTMIYHTPEVKEKLMEFGIPVLVDYSSYEPNPLGRIEWMKLYSVLLGKEDLAEELFQKQAAQVEALESEENTGKTVAFFYITSSGYANVRKPGDYVSKMIEMAGGTYIFSNLDTGDDNALSTMNMQMEEFYAKAKDADYVIYNSTIDGELKSLDAFLDKSALLADFKAVKEGNVWCLSKSMFQDTSSLGNVILDIHSILTEEHPEDHLEYLYCLE
ncbi:MAG: ABC transporter substrate-binding protein [Eubacteriales bacterium]|nr:ABC transporter substrate-binding protein [Eubacteriales bacterium]